ncbi:dynein axonemal heavy chain 11 isoform X3 [Anomalospiza imberbis]|uniref:dynein axonemal heavy chain 11 isoform X3 n=1 Tax=Anomalospiza imberbis TaxID=187417 RepID=UPI00358E76DF
MWIQDTPSESSIDDWTKTQWREINVEQMDVQLRRFAKAGYTAIYFCNLSVSVPPLPHSSHPLGCFGKAFSSRRPSQTFWDSSFIKVEDEVQSIVVNAVQELSTEKFHMYMILKSKYVVYFIEEVKGWQSKLNMANSVVSIWMEFQCMWYLHQTVGD